VNRECPACGTVTSAPACCGVAFDRPFAMTSERIRALRSYAHGRKGLDDATYRLHLRAVGARSTTTLTRDQHDALMRRLGQLPDRQRQGRAGR
jgi:hypothetical protein